MNIEYLKLLAAALLVALAVILLYLADKKTAFGKLSRRVKQLIIGVVFGLLAVFATEFGININGATLNARDAAPICAGLIFGAPAGIIAGLIGGVERWFAVLWGAGEYTRLACSLSTIFAGVFSAALRKYMFDDKKPSWFYGLAVGLVMEVLHMLMVFITNMGDIQTAFSFVERCSAPMIIFNGFAVMIATLAVSLLGRDSGDVLRRGSQRKLAQTFQHWLLLCVVVAFCATCWFTIFLQTRLSESESENLLSLNITDVRQDIRDASDDNLLKLTRKVAVELNAAPQPITNEALQALALASDLSEIDVIDENGIITACTNESFVGYDMADGQQSAAFLVLLTTESELVQSYQPISYDATLSRKYAGVRLAAGGFVQVGYDAESFQNDIAGLVRGSTKNRHIGEQGCVLICDEQGVIVSDRHGFEGHPLSRIGMSIDLGEIPENTLFTAAAFQQQMVCMYAASEGYTVIAMLPESEATFSRNLSVYVMAFMEVILFAVLFAMIYFLIKRLVVDNISNINSSLAQITNGNLNVLVDVRSNEEFASLSDDINSTVTTLKRYIAEAAARIDKELEFAHTIQNAALPSVFPPFPNKTEFDLYATMHTAKEVGGDFYDFYLVGDDRLAFLIADVSGKGIPAAMFMMTAKTLIKSLAETGMRVEEVLLQANKKLCEGNDAGMFVTAWLGILDLNTGLIHFANAGHNPPLLKRSEGGFEFLRSRAGLVLAGMETSKYRPNEVQLLPGDVLYLYTDGVTEATDANDQLYGEPRLQATLNAHATDDVSAITAAVKSDIDAFVADAPQFDDITMLALRWHGSDNEPRKQ